VSRAAGCTVPADARAARGVGRGASPRAVTRGEENTDCHLVSVDWLNATFPAPDVAPGEFVALLGRMLGRPVSAVEGGGFLGFARSLKLYAHHGADMSALGFLAYGGASQAGRWLLSLTGTGCSFVRDWQGVADLLSDLEAKITRLDLACDFLEGEHSVDEAVSWYEFGGFDTCKSLRPSSRIDGDWLGGQGGRTLYVGKAQNGKMLRVYEKGRQLGDPASEWVRFEVQLGSRDRVIPYEALTEREAFFAGCYPALEEMVSEAAQRIETSREKGSTTLAHLWKHAKRSYGKFFDALARYTGATNTDLIEEVRIVGLPRRVDHSSAVAGVVWADVLARSKGV